MDAAGSTVPIEQLLAGNPSAGSPAGLESLLSDHADPRVRLLAQLLSRREAENAEAEAALPDPAKPPADLLAGARTELRLRRKMQKLLQELERLQEINDTLAAALGACPLCWGEEPECPECAGQGEPGSLRPDRALFSQLVVPALRRLKITAGSRNRPATNPSPTESHEAKPIERRLS